MQGASDMNMSVMQAQTQSMIDNSNTDMNMKEDLKRMKKENMTYQETINRVIDHILSQPGLLKAIGLTEENNEKLMQQNGTTKVKKAMEIVSLVNNYV